MLLSSATLGNVKYEMTDIYPTNLPGMDRKPKMCYGYLRDLTHSKFSKESMLVSIVITPERKTATVFVL